jgi:hypothetical protein
VPDKKFDLGDYIEVKDRIAKFYELYGQGRLVTGEVRLTTEPDGVPRVLVQGLAYRTPDDPLPGQGWSWMALPGTTSYTKGSELENTETSAWGRAIGSLGILIDRSIASSNEIQNKADQTQSTPRTMTVGTQEVTSDGGLIGTAIIQGNQDMNLRQSPNGYTLPFRIKNGAKSFIIVAENDMAKAVELMRAQILDQRVTVWGKWTDETIPAKGVKPEIKYRILHLTKLQTPDFILPADVQEDLLPQPPDDVSLVGEKPEAETAPLFDELPI